MLGGFGHLPGPRAHLQMSLSSVGTNSPDSVSSVAKPPMAYRVPARLTRLSELRSCGKASKGAHLVGRRGREEVHHPAAPGPQLQLHLLETRIPSTHAPSTTFCVLTLPAPPSSLPHSPAPPVSLHGPLVIASSLPRTIHHGSSQWPSFAPELILPGELPSPGAPAPTFFPSSLPNYSQGVFTPLLWP